MPGIIKRGQLDPASALVEQHLPGNMLERLEVTESLFEEKDVEDAPTIEELQRDKLGIFSVMISPAEGILVTDPTDTGYTGVFVAGNGLLFGVDTYVLGSVAAGVIKAGFRDDGTFYAEDAVISGTIIIGTGSEVGGWFINSTSIFNGQLSLDSSIPAILMGSASAIMTGSGVFIGNDAGTYKMRIGNPAGNYLLWDGTTLAASGQWIKSAGMNPALQEWQTNIVFSSASDTQINWTSGTIRLSDGTTYSISSGNTGAMAALTYIYLDVSVSSTVLQITTTYSTAVGDGKVLVAAAQNATSGASVIAYSGQQPIINGGAQITALSILAGNIAAGAITASKISVTSLSAITANMGALTIDGILTMSGAGGAITIGTTPPGGPASGTGLWIDRTGVYSLIAGIQQTTLTSEGLSAGAGAALLGRDGLELRNNALTDEEASVFMNDLGWVFNQVAEANGFTRKLRMGMRDVGSGEPEGVIQYNTPGSEVTIPNYDFATLDMTNWSVVEKGLILNALGTLSTAFTISAVLAGNDGNIYVCGSSFTTSSVWKYDVGAGTWAAYGNLSTTFIPRAMAQIGSDIYVGLDSTGSPAGSKVWKSTAGGNFAAFGALSAAVNVYSLLAVGSDIYVGGENFSTSGVYKSTAGANFAAYGTAPSGVNNFCRALAVIGSDIYAGGSGAGWTTSRVWKSASGGAWAAYGTLSTAFTVQALAVIGSDIYAGGASFTTSSVWKSAAGGAWAAYGTLGTAFSVRTLLPVGSDLYAGGNSFTTSSVWRSVAGAAWDAFGYLTNTFSIAGLIALNSDIFAGGSSFTTSAVWKFDIQDWSASTGLATVSNNKDMIPEFQNAARFAVTAGNQIQISASNSGLIAGGTLIITIAVKFYTAISGGSLVSTVTAFTRTLTADGGLLKMDGTVTVPATATHAVISAKFSQTAGVQSTVAFDRFLVEIVSGVKEIIFDDDHIWTKSNGVRSPLTVGIKNQILRVSAGPSDASEVTVFTAQVPGGLMGINDGLAFDCFYEYFNNSAAVRTFVIKVYYGSAGVIILTETIGNTTVYRGGSIKVRVRNNGATNAQVVFSELLFQTTGNIFAGLNSTYAGGNNVLTLAADSTAAQEFKITMRHGASNANLYSRMSHAELRLQKEFS